MAEYQSFCEICGPRSAAALIMSGKARHGEYKVLACEACSLWWTDPLSFRDSAIAIKSEQYFAQDVYEANAESQKARFRGQLEQMVRATKIDDSRRRSEIRLLEVGAGMGYFLDVCEESGILGEGCDISAAAAAYANKNRQRVRVGTLDESYTNASMDVVVAFNLIEHLSHPKEFLFQTKRILKPGGFLVLETPIQESLFHRVALIASKALRGRIDSFGLRPGGHTYKFSKRTFGIICNDMGFRLIYGCNVGSPFGEIWGKSGVISAIDFRALYRLALLALAPLAAITGQGNRFFVVLQRV